MAKKPNFRDPRGHSLRIYSDVYDSPAFAALSPHDVLAYLALLRELKRTNNGDLSLPLSRAKTCGIGHPKTLARSLRALCAVGLVALTRRGGCTKGGQRLPSLYRLTDRDCYAIPAKHLEAKSASNEWKRVTDMEHGLELIEAAEAAVLEGTKKLKTLGHAVNTTDSLGALVRPKNMAPRDPWNGEPGHGVNMDKNSANPVSMRASSRFSPEAEKASHRARHSTPLHIAIHAGQLGCFGESGNYRRLTTKPAGLFTNFIAQQGAAIH